MRRRRRRKKKREETHERPNANAGASFPHETDDHRLEGRMLENKRERLKTFLRKIDEKAIVRIKHFMKER